jgi:hypothetical protein
MALIDKIKAIADAIRAKTGTTAPLTLDEMAESIEFLEADGGSPLETLILVDEDGYEMAATLTEEEVELTATPNDIRIGTTAVTDTGVTVGEKEIPSYYTNEGFKAIPNGSRIVLTTQSYDYTKLQAIICSFNTSLSNSTSAEKVAINGNLYPVRSTSVEATITKNDELTQIDFGITNDSGSPYVVRYFMYKEIY